MQLLDKSLRNAVVSSDFFSIVESSGTSQPALPVWTRRNLSIISSVSVRTCFLSMAVKESPCYFLPLFRFVALRSIAHRPTRNHTSTVVLYS